MLPFWQFQSHWRSALNCILRLTVFTPESRSECIFDSFSYSTNSVHVFICNWFRTIWLAIPIMWIWLLQIRARNQCQTDRKITSNETKGKNYWTKMRVQPGWGEVLQTKNDNNHNRKNQWYEKSIIFFYRIAFCCWCCGFQRDFLAFFWLVFREIRKLNLKWWWLFGNDVHSFGCYSEADALTVKFNWLVHIIIWCDLLEKWTWWAHFHMSFFSLHWLDSFIDSAVALHNNCVLLLMFMSFSGFASLSKITVFFFFSHIKFACPFTYDAINWNQCSFELLIYVTWWISHSLKILFGLLFWFLMRWKYFCLYVIWMRR